MLSKDNRFRGRPALNLVFRRGVTTRNGSFSLRYYGASKNDQLRVAIVVSRKVHKNAVVRNRIRRRIYSLIEPQIPKFKSGDLVVIVHDAALAEWPHDQMKHRFEAAFKKAGVLVKPDIVA